MSLDAKILELRLLIKESSLGQASVSKCAAKLNAFGRNLNDKNALESFIREILMYQLDFEKTDKMFRALARQNEEYNLLERSIEDNISCTKDNITRLEEELRQQKCIREHRVECEQAASIVNKHPSRSMLKRKIDAVSQSLDGTNASIDMVEAEIALKQTFFKQVLQSIADLQRSGAPQAEEESKTAGGAEGEDAADANEDDERDDNRDARASKADRDAAEEEVPVELDEDGNPIESNEEGEEDNDTVEGMEGEGKEKDDAGEVMVE
jgi:ferritin-like metal-binding protein YciE